jgi:adenine/guanine phosphoribosyltransferase-like PRPP-binding protein
MQGKWLVEHKQVYDQTVLVLDDFSTTGNTLHSFAQALIRAGAHKVLAVSLVRNLGDNDATWILPLLEADHAAGRLWSPTENKRDVLM